MIYLCKIVGMPFIKIGYSESPEKRYAILNGASPFDIVCLAERSGSRLLEKGIHERCAEYLVKNEWYHDLCAVRDAFFMCYDPEPKCKNAIDIFNLKSRERDERILYFGHGSQAVYRNAKYRYERSIKSDGEQS